MCEIIVLGFVLLVGVVKGMFGWKLDDFEIFKDVNIKNGD